MREKFGFLIWLWFLLCGNCLGRFVVEKNSLKVLSPQWIKGVYECAIQNIGLPQYGGTLFGTVVYPTANREACWSFDDFESFKWNPGSLPIILLVDRGECYFTLKAWNAQIAGAAAVLVVDNKYEALITFDTPDEEYPSEGYIQKITIPSALISKQLGESIKNALTGGDTVVLNLDLTESLRPHLESDEQAVDYEFWTNSDYECGPSCHEQIDFISSFKQTAHMLEQRGHTRFTTHYITWYCPEALILSKQCRSQCIRHGRYCAADPAVVGYDGRDVMVQNLRQACVFKVAKQSGNPWLWWDYVTAFALRCTMKEHKFTKKCADQVIQSLGVDVGSVDDCIGDVNADLDHPVLKAEQNAQIGNGIRGDVTMLPTLMINNRHYRGKLENAAVLRTIWAEFNDKNGIPSISLSEGDHLLHLIYK